MPRPKLHRNPNDLRVFWVLESFNTSTRSQQASNETAQSRSKDCPRWPEDLDCSLLLRAIETISNWKVPTEKFTDSASFPSIGHSTPRRTCAPKTWGSLQGCWIVRLLSAAPTEITKIGEEQDPSSDHARFRSGPLENLSNSARCNPASPTLWSATLHWLRECICHRACDT